jgi:hypothetical protein
MREARNVNGILLENLMEDIHFQYQEGDWTDNIKICIREMEARIAQPV